MMHQLTKVTLENEMDLILAHKRSMKLAELAGLSLSAQTTFATAVSEVSRATIENGKSGSLVLSVQLEQRERYIVATLKDKYPDESKTKEGLEFAKKLVNKLNVSQKENETSIELFYYINPSFRIDIHKLDEWRNLFRNEPPISPYDELKRKNEQLQELSGRILKSEEQYRTLTNSLPLIIFTIDLDGQLIYANEWLSKYTGVSIEHLNNTRWNTVVYSGDYDAFSLMLKNQIIKGTTAFKIQARLRNHITEEYNWHLLSLSPFNNEKGDLQYWIGYIVDIHAQKLFEDTLRDNEELKQAQQQLKVNQHTLETYITELNRSNQELQQFAFIASHDLQEPVRKLLFYSDYLVNKYTGSFDEAGVAYLKNMNRAAKRMRILIQDILLFSQINKGQIQFKEINLGNILKETAQDFEILIKEKNAVINVKNLPSIHGDERMITQLFENIISNALKYADLNKAPVIDVEASVTTDDVEISFADNGVGFDERYVDKMFNLFQRLHSKENYEGTGLGLAICKKIVELHHGTIRATGKENEGATFFVKLPLKPVIS